jgi:hypothetical protein
VKSTFTKGDEKRVFLVEECTLTDDQCPEGWLRANRETFDRMLQIAFSEQRCRRELLSCHDDLQDAGGSRWDPLTVTIVVGGVTIAVGGAAFLVGYLVGK